MSNNAESENFGANTQEALRKFRLKLLTIIDEKCPVDTQITFGNGDAITITFLECAHERVRKATAGGRGSRVRRRKRREMQQLQYQQMQLHQLGIHNIPRRWPRQENIAARKENNNNEGHLLNLLMDQIKNMHSRKGSQ